jgi:hypothetical protein
MRTWTAVVLIGAVFSGCAGASGYWEPIADPINGKAYPCCWYPHGYKRWVVGVKPEILPQTKGIVVVGKPPGTVATIHDFFIEPQEQGVPVDPNTGRLVPLPNPSWDWMLSAVIRGLKP